MSRLRTTGFICAIISMGLLSSGCGLILTYMFRPCDVKINEHYITASCGLTNGAYFEELAVDSLNDEGIPAIYRILSQFDCGYVYQTTDEIRTEWPKKLYFDKENDHFRWSADTLEHVRLAVESGRGRHLFRIDSLSGDTIEASYAYAVFKPAAYTTCPIAFKPETWYFLTIMDQSLSGIYLYVDKQMKFHVYELESGVSPI